MINKYLLLSSVLITSSVFSSQIVHERVLKEKTFPASDDCHLKKFSTFTVDNEYVNFGGGFNDSRSTLFASLWETSSPDCLKDYGVVQYIKGCIYDLIYNPKDGSIERYFGHVRESRGERIKFQHREWEVDTVDIDPLYASYSKNDATEENRFDWNKYPKTRMELSQSASVLKKWDSVFFNSAGYGYVQDMPLTQKRLMTTDLPTGSDYDPNGALGKDWITISSLEFKTCLYKTKDIPMSGSPVSFNESFENGGPLVCFDWSDKSKPNFETKKIERTNEFDPFCFK